jgi:phytoene/squalene synthetase
MDSSVQAFSVRSAGAIVRQSSGFTYVLSLLMPARDRLFFWNWYAYLRWVDDVVDDADATAHARSGFLERQQRLVERIYAGESIGFSKDEAPLRALVAYDRGRGSLLKEPICEMLSAMHFDIMRVGKLSSHAELRRNFDREVSSYLFTIGYFCRIPEIPAKVPGRSAANGAKVAHILRDFLADCDQGHLNISREEISAYGLALPTIKSDIVDPRGRHWVAVNVRLAEHQLSAGLREVCSVGDVRYRVIVACLVAKYQSYIDHFRASDFVLKAPAALGWAFAKNLCANLAALFIRKNRGVSGPASGKMPQRLVACTLSALALLHLKLLPLLNPSIVATLREALKGVVIPPGDFRKLRRRFVTAYWLGRASCAAISPMRDRAHDKRIHCAGLAYAFWSLAALELDSLIDDHAMPADRAEAMVEDWLGTIADALGNTIVANARACSDPHGREPEERNRAFGRLSSALQRSLVRYKDLAIDPGSHEPVASAFLAEARAVLFAQVKSRDQQTIDPSHDWSWYLTQLLNQKTLGFVFAPWALWALDDRARLRRSTLEQAFLTLNAGYDHWQILDDLADIKGDTRQGRITTPGFILVSQGAIAERIIACSNGTQFDNGALLDAVRNSKLVCERFANSPLSDGIRHLIDVGGPDNKADVIDSLLRCALANHEDDNLASLRQLALARQLQARNYLAALKSGDSHLSCGRRRRRENAGERATRTNLRPRRVDDASHH